MVRPVIGNACDIEVVSEQLQETIITLAVRCSTGREVSW
jgi:hypothetical protein